MGGRRRLVWETYGDLGITVDRQVTTPEEVMAGWSGRRVWWCEYPEFNDPYCMTGMSWGEPMPEKAALPDKHTRCRYVWIVEEDDDE